MPSYFTYETHQAIDAERSRHRERDFSHIRALKGDERAEGIVSRMVGSLGRLRAAAPRGSATVLEARESADKACRLPDGSMGRWVAVRESGDSLTEVCIPT